jgi:hypothetical protein
VTPDGNCGEKDGVAGQTKEELVEEVADDTFEEEEEEEDGWPKEKKGRAWPEGAVKGNENVGTAGVDEDEVVVEVGAEDEVVVVAVEVVVEVGAEDEEGTEDGPN